MPQIDLPSESPLSAEDLQFLTDNMDKLPPDTRDNLKVILEQRQVGCRTNHWMRRIRPNLHPKQRMFLGLEHREVMFGGAAGGAKAMLLLTSCNATKLGYNCSEPSQLQEFRMRYAQNVLTPFGFKPIDDIKVGDTVCNPDGTTASVIATHFPGKKKCYEIEFHDGAKCIVADDHQWAMKVSGKRTRRKVADPYSSEYASSQERFNMELMRRYKTVATSSMITAFRWAEAQKADEVRPNWPLIPLTEPVNTTLGVGRTSMCPPYTLGVLLGDGKLSQDGQVSWSKPDYFIADAIRAELAEWKLSDTVSDHANGESHGICGRQVLNCLRSLSLMGAVSGTKFIPTQYRNGSIQLRTALVQGLMDTDGHVDGRGQCYYSTVSKQLAEDVQYILRSLGYTATVSLYEEPTYVHNGEKKIGQPSYRTYVSGRNRRDLFRLPRKQELITELNNEGGRRVVAIREIGDNLDVKCITVSHPNGLYITNDFIVTHNSDSLLLSMMQYLDEPGYCSIIFRRTFKDLSGAGSIMDRAKSWFTPWESDGVRWSSADNSFYFPTGKGKQPSRFAFAYLQHDDDKRNYQGWELNACVKTTTKVMMGDGSRKTVAQIQVGDIVATPEGPRPVTKVWEPERKKCVEIQVFDTLGRLTGSQVQSLDHAFMSDSGWISYDLIESSESRQSNYQHRSAWQPGTRFQSTSRNHGIQSGRRQRQFSLAQSHPSLLGQLDSFASSAVRQSDFGVSGDSPQEGLPLLGLCGPLMLFSPYPRSASGAARQHDAGHDSPASLARDSQSCYPSYFRFCDEPPRHVRFFDQDEQPSRFYAETPIRRSLSSDDMERIREYNLLSSSMYCHQEQTETECLESSQPCVFSANEKIFDKTVCGSLQVISRPHRSFFHQGQSTLGRQLFELPHPYADRMLVVSESHSLGSFRVSGFCDAEVRNIQVAGSSCYITELGICNRNCAFDELTQHPRESYSYLFSRLRRLKGSKVPIRMRSATNPGGKFGDWVKEDFIPDEYLALSKEPDKQFGRVWEKRTDCAECNGSGIMDLMSCIYCEGFGYRTRYFVPSRIQDNPSIDMAEYLRSLINLPPVERYRLEKGDWTVSELGDLFKPEWVRYYHRRGDHFILARPDQADIIVPINELTTFVTADTASKEKTTSDFTCISSWGYHQRSGSLILIHALMTRMEVPRIADAILAQSSACRAEFVMIEDAQCGIGVIQELRGPKGKGIAIQNYNPNGVDKIARSTTAQVKMAAGQIFFPSGQPGWLVEPYAQLLGFPQASHDDFVDTVSMAASWVQSRHYISCGSTPGILEPVGRYLSFDTVHGITTYRAR